MQIKLFSYLQSTFVSQSASNLNELSISAGLKIQPRIFQALSQHGINTLEDVRKTGGIRRLTNLSSLTGEPELQKLEAYANLSILSADIELNTTLINQGFSSIQSIATIPRESFVSRVADVLGADVAASLHQRTRAQKAVLDNILTARRVDAANRYQKQTRSSNQVQGGQFLSSNDFDNLSANTGELNLPPVQQDLPETKRCECRDCDAAVSPRAYLADLLAYAVDYRITKPGNIGGKVYITLDDLVSTFHQPFAKLPASCTSVEEEFRQVRLCVEVLRKYLGSRPFANGSESKLKAAEQDYRLQAYKILLTQIGTSYEEIRRIQFATEQQQNTLAERLGLDRSSRLRALLLDAHSTQPSSNSRQPNSLTEKTLESLFGLVATANPDGSAITTPVKVRWDAEGISPLFINFQPAGFVFPDLLSWRLNYLQRQWQIIDWPTDPSTAGEETDDTPPLIDPDIISQDHCKSDAARNLWEKRRQWISDQLLGGAGSLIPGGLTNISGSHQQHFAQLIQAIWQDPATLVALAERRAEGEDLTDALQSIQLSPGTFSYLVRMQELVAGGAQLLDSEWGEVYNILVQVLKQRLFWQWRTEEKNKNVILSPWHFKVPESIGLEFPPRKPELPPVWRGTRRERRDWEDRLQSRIDQRQSVIDGLREAVSSTEESTLPLLRDALIAASDAQPIPIETKAKSLTDQLLIETRASGCQKITRISQAIQTLQALLWSLRTGQLTAYPDWELKSLNFDEGWKWLGSYATWRAALFVYLYPENILYPTLRKWQTSGFEELSQKLQIGRRLNPQAACELAEEFSNYYYDLNHLDIQASCQVGDSVYWFGRAPSGECYWSRYNKNLTTDTSKTACKGNFEAAPQSSWRKIQCLSGKAFTLKLFAAVPFGAFGISVIAKQKKDSKYQLVIAKFNFGNGSWDSNDEAEEMDLHPSIEDFDAVASQIRNSDDKVTVIAQYNRKPYQNSPNFGIYQNQLNSGMDGWEGEWKNIWEDPNFLKDERGQGPESSNIQIKALIPISSLGRSICFSALFYFSNKDEIIKYAVLKTEDRTLESGPINSSIPLVKIRCRPSEDVSFIWCGYGDDSYEIDELREGKSLYLDSNLNYVWKNLEAFKDREGNVISNLTYIKTKRIHSGITDGSFLGKHIERVNYFTLSFSVDRPVNVFIAYDKQNTVPNWLVGWSCSGHVTVSDGSGEYRRELYSKRFSSGTITLGSNSGSEGRSGNMYNVLIQPIQQDECRIEGVSFDVGEAQNLGSGSAKTWLGAFAWPSTSSIYTFWGDAVGVSNSLRLSFDDLQSPLRFPPILASSGECVNRTISELRPSSVPGENYTGVKKIAVDSGKFSENGCTLAHKKSDFKMVWSARTYIDSGTSDNEFSFLDSVGNYLQILPQDFDSLPLTKANFDASLQERRNYSEAVIKAHLDNRVPEWTATYIREYYYFVPLLIALELQRRGYYQEALDWYRTIYDYTESSSTTRKIWYGLQEEEEGTDNSQLVEQSKETEKPQSLERSEDWLRDPLNPHAIASIRPNTYTRFTLLSLIRCFLEYADFEFTLDTAESVPRARALYTTALELLENEGLQQQTDNQCEATIADLKIKIGEDETISEGIKPGLNDLLSELEQLDDLLQLEAAAEEILDILENGSPSIPPERPTNGRPPVAEQPSRSPEELLAQVESVVQKARGHIQPPKDFGTLLGTNALHSAGAHTALLAEPEVFAMVSQLGFSNLENFELFQPTSTFTAGLSPARSEERLLEGRLNTMPESLAANIPAHLIANSDLNRASESSRSPVFNDPNTLYFSQTFPSSFQRLAPGETIIVGYIPAPSFEFCIPLNPVLRSLRLRAELNLHKLRNCRNIAGMERELDPYAAPTDTESGLPVIGEGGRLFLPGTIHIQPTPYRYSVLIERAKQLVNQAQQFEAAMLSALEKRDNEYYQLFKARQDIRLNRAGARLQNLRVREAEDSVVLAELQRYRAEIQVEHFTELIDEGLNTLEELSMILQVIVAAGYATASAILAGKSIFGSPQLAADAARYAAQAADKTASILLQYASFERREQEWQFQKRLAEQDVLIGDQGVKLAQDRVRIVGQEFRIAEIQVEHAEATAEFLANKFTNTQLYEWMSITLEGVYSFFLQQATSMAKLAENQLTFERQQVLQAIIQADYWEPPSDFTLHSSEEGNTPDRRGLTGSARLLQDITQLDQYAFETNQRKLQLTKTISLAQRDPFTFQRFREAGVLPFETPMELFDRDFPGHYLRLIQRVRTSVIALIPPIQGIHATLSTPGLSRVVISPDVFQTVPIRRNPEEVAFSSPQNATGLFELREQSEMLLPFEGMGVDTTWEFSMPKASNLFDYSTIADVLITIEYTALNSYDYRQQVIEELDSRISADRPFSFRNEFADQWYDLNNPDQTATPMAIQFELRRSDFPPNIEYLKIQHVVLYFVRKDGETFEVSVNHLHFTEQGSNDDETVGGEAQSIDGFISTRRGNAASWAAMIDNKSPFGQWELAFPDAPGDVLADGRRVRDLFKEELIEDILFVITYQGNTPEWPA